MERLFQKNQMMIPFYFQYYPEMEVATKEQEGEKAAKEREKQERLMH